MIEASALRVVRPDGNLDGRELCLPGEGGEWEGGLQSLEKTLMDHKCATSNTVTQADEDACDKKCKAEHPGEKECAAGCHYGYDEEEGECALYAECVSCAEDPTNAAETSTVSV